MTKPVFETFEIELQNTLYNIYDPIYSPETSIYEVTGVLPAAGLEAVRAEIFAAIEALSGRTAVPETAKSSVLYRILQHRFMMSLSQERAAELLGMSSRHLRRKQNEAVHALALHLWRRRYGTGSLGPLPPEPAQSETVQSETSSAETWADVVLREIEVLNNQTAGVSTDLETVIRRTVEMAAYLRQDDPQRAAVELEVGSIPPGIEVPVHPSVLRQVLLYIIDQIIVSGYRGKIGLALRAGPEQAVLSIRTCQPGPAALDLARIRELAGILGGWAELVSVDNGCALELVFRRSQVVSVLVVDDNYEIIQLYRRFTAGTRYKINHHPGGADSGKPLLEHIRELAPDLLIIDVLMPGTDGWDLLLQLRQDPATRSTPVIVCSVLGSADIARSLGANAYLPKPVDRKSLLEALDGVG